MGIEEAIAAPLIAEEVAPAAAKGALDAGGALAPAAGEAAAAGAAPLVEGVDFTTLAGAQSAAQLGIPEIGITKAVEGGVDSGALAALGAGLGGLAGGSGAAPAGSGGIVSSSTPPVGSPEVSTMEFSASAPKQMGISSPVAGGQTAAALGSPDITTTGIDSLPSIGPGSSTGAPLSLAAPADTPAAAAAKAATAGGGISDWASNNKGLLASLGIGGAGILASPYLSKAINKVPQQGNLDALAAQERSLQGQQQATGAALIDPLLSGNLPAGAKTQVDNAFQDAIGTTKAKYANLGLSGSTMEADAIASITKQKEALSFQIAEQMATTGQQALSGAANALGLQDTVYSQLMQAQVQQDTALQQAIASFAGAAALGQGIGAAKKA